MRVWQPLPNLRPLPSCFLLPTPIPPHPSCADVEANIQKLVAQYKGSKISTHVADHVKVRCGGLALRRGMNAPCAAPASRASLWPKRYAQALEGTPGDKYVPGQGQPGWAYQTSVLTTRTFLNK